MNQSATREPLYKPESRVLLWKGKESECERPYSKKPYEDSYSDEEENFNARCTEISDETGESQPGQKKREWEAWDRLLERQRTFSKLHPPENYLLHSYFADMRESKKDKMTQKNLISPYPSFLKPPMYTPPMYNAHNYRMPIIESSREGENDMHRHEKSLRRPSPKNIENLVSGSDPICFHHHQREQMDPKVSFYDKHKPETEPRVLQTFAEKLGMTCFQGESALGAGIKHSMATVETERFSKNSNDAATTNTSSSDRKPKTPIQEVDMREMSKNCPSCTRQKYSENAKNKPWIVGPSDSEKEIKVHESFLHHGGVKCGNARKHPEDGKLKEKLVYVVEEEGKNVSKLETDLFSVNEILSIKKDLLELSEFAKKLKKLKDMKKESEKGKHSNSSCHCKPAADLLKDVNRRIEALEARQEELERGSNKSEKLISADSEFKKIEKAKSSSETPPKTPIMKKSAMTSVPSFPKSEMIVSRAEGFSNNSEIVSELLDIKTQLQKLEKRRMSKELSPEAVPMGDSKLPKKKDHAIAVFSSRTYILTSENYSKEKNKKTPGTHLGDKTKDMFNLSDSKIEKVSKSEEKNRKMKADSDKAKENVANWLKNVSPLLENSSNEIGVSVTPDLTNKKNSLEEDGKSGSRLKCRKCAQTLTDENSDNQEPQKNRATDKETDKGEADIEPLKKEKGMKLSRDVPSRVDCQECYMTPSGRLFAFGPKLKVIGTLPLEKEQHKTSASADRQPPKVIPNLYRKSVSGCSIPSMILAKEQIRKARKDQNLKRRHCEALNLNSSFSKSMQDLSLNSNASKIEKMVPEKDAEALEQLAQSSSYSKDKKIKDVKAEKVGKEQEGTEKTKKNSGKGDYAFNLSRESQLIGTVSLETNSNEITRVFRGNELNKQQIFSVTAVSKSFKYGDSTDKSTKILSEEKEEKKEEEEEENEERVKKHKSDHKAHEKSSAKKEKTSKTEKSHKSRKDIKSERTKKSHKKKCRKCFKDRPRRSSSLECCQEKLFFSTVESKIRGEEYEEGKKKKCTHFHRHSGEADCDDPRCTDGLVLNYYSEECFDKESKRKHKRKHRHRSNEVEEEEQEPKEESCVIKNFFKNLRGLYPRFSHLQFIPWFGYGDKDYKRNKKEEDQDEDDKHKKAKDKESKDLHHEKTPEHLKNCKCVKVYLQTQARNEEWPGCRKGSRVQRNVSEASLTQTSNTSEADGLSENLDFPNRKSQVFFVGRVSEDRGRGKSKRRRRSRSRSSITSEDGKKKKREKRGKKKKKKLRIKTKKKEKCICSKCGHVHKPKKPKKKKRKRSDSDTEPTDSTTSFKSTTSDTEAKENEKEMERKEEEKKKKEEERKRKEEEKKKKEEVKKEEKSKGKTKNAEREPSPMFSFLKGFCFRKNVSPSRSSMFNKLRELGYLRGYCPSKCGEPRQSIERVVERRRSSTDSRSGSISSDRREAQRKSSPKPSKKCDCQEARSDSKSEGSPKTRKSDCECEPKLLDLEQRLQSLEQGGKRRRRSKSKRSDSTDTIDSKKKRKRRRSRSRDESGKKKKKKKKKKRRNSSLESVDGEGKKKRRRRRRSSSQDREKKKKKGKGGRRKRRSSTDSSLGDEKESLQRIEYVNRTETPVYLCTSVSVTSKNNFDESSATKAFPEDSLSWKVEEDGCPKRGERLRKRLSSFHTLWKNWMLRKAKGYGDLGTKYYDVENLMGQERSRSSLVPAMRVIYGTKNESQIESEKLKRRKTEKEKEKEKENGEASRSKSKSRRRKS